MKPLFLIALGFLLINQQTFCQENRNNLMKISINFDEIGEAKMSDIFSEIQYIPLETKSECLIGYMDIVFFDNEILIRSHGNNSIYRFTDKGKFINKIGNLGRGPAEYQDYSDVRLINDTVFVISAFTASVLCYKLDGNFLKRYDLGAGIYPVNITHLNDKSFMIALMNQSSPGYIIKTDRNFNVEKRLSIQIPFESNALPFGFQQSANKIYYYDNFLDTIYDVSRGTLVPSIIIDYGKFKIGKERRSVDPKRSEILNKPYISVLYTSNNYLEFEILYPYKNSSYTVLYRNSDGVQTSWLTLVNDIDNGILGNYYRLFGDKIVYRLMPVEVLKHFEKMTAKEKSDPKNAGFVQMASNLDVNSNPVLMICKIK